MCYSQVTIRVMNRGEAKDIWFVFETPHETLEEQHDQMIRDGGLRGTRHETRADQETGSDRHIIDSYEAFIDRSAIMIVTELRSRLYGKDGERLA